MFLAGTYVRGIGPSPMSARSLDTLMDLSVNDDPPKAARSMSTIRCSITPMKSATVWACAISVS